MTKELLSTIYMIYMDSNNYSYQPYDLDANWRYWMKDGGQGKFSWLWYLVNNDEEHFGVQK